MTDAAVCACAVFVVAYAAFRLAQPWIVAAVTPRPVEDFMYWAQWAATEHDGLEVPVAFAGIVACVALCFAWVRSGFARRVLAFLPVRIAVALAALWIVIGIRSTEFSHSARASWLLAAFGALVAACVWLRPRIVGSRWIGLSALGALALVVVGVCVGTSGEPSFFDYGYFIGPALEWQQGEALGSFYMQYSTFALLLTSALMRLDLHINGMQLAFVCMSIAWFAMEWWLARAVIRDRALRALFLITLVAFRLLWMLCNIAAIPQVAPFRMDLWVPLVLVARTRGLTSPWTAACCGILYALDGLFGFFYAAAYVVFTALEFWSTRRSGLPSIARLAGLIAPIALALAFNLALFGSPIASSASRYMGAKLGFLPIPTASLSWAVFILLLLSVVAIARDDSGRRFGMFVVAITIAQLVYFLGRSHDHNLINVSAAWLTALFMALDLSYRARGAWCNGPAQ